MTQHDLSEIDLHDGEQRIRLRRGLGPMPIAMPAVAPAPLAVAGTTSPPKSDGASPPPSSGKKLIEIKSITPGTFYSAPSPDAPPFVKLGSKVTPTTVVGLIEAMKLFNEINAECTGTVAEVLVENQQ